MVGVAHPDEVAFVGPDVLGPALQPALGVREECTAQHGAFVPAGVAPLAQRDAEAFLPRPEGEVGLDPCAQPFPAGYQCFMCDLHGFGATWLTVGHDQPGDITLSAARFRRLQAVLQTPR